ncbi:MAG: hypothetical protein ACREOA_05720 [Candidatus Dormibacteria bacterium]
MAARRYPAAKDPDTGKFTGPWIWSDERGERPIYYIDPLTAWEDERRSWLPGLRGKFERLVARLLGLGRAEEDQP